MWGTFWASFGQSPLHDKVLQRGAHFGPHLVEVRCMTKSSDEGLFLGPHLVKVRSETKSSNKGHHCFFATFGHCLLHVNFVCWLIMGIIFWQHLTKVCCVTLFLLC
jgi:hypothetical protein